MGISIYLDEGEQVGLNDQPFWYGGLLHVFNMGQNHFRAELNTGPEDTAAYALFDKAAARLRSGAGGVISIYYHPTEFVNTEFWDAVNFAHGANPDRAQWKRPNARTKQESERCYGVLRKFVEHMKQAPDVRFVTVADLLKLYAGPLPGAVERKLIAEHISRGITFMAAGGQVLSPADMLIALLGIPPQIVDGPVGKGVTTWEPQTIPRWAFDRATQDAAGFIKRNHRLPNEVFVGAETLSLADFTATLAESFQAPSDSVRLMHGQIAFERYFSTDPAKSFAWPIHPKGFAAPELLELGKLQGWTLKPARFRHP